MARHFLRLFTPIFIFCQFLMVMGGVGWYLLCKQPDTAKVASPALRQYHFAGPEQELTDFSCQVSVAGMRIFSLKGHKLILQKKKVGFFRFGLLKEAMVDHASFELSSSWNKSIPASRNRDEQSDISQNLAAVFFGQRVAGLVCMPVSFVVNQDGPTGGTARIEADRADLVAGGRSVRFRGNVRLTSCNNSLEASEMELYPEAYRIVVAKAYTLVTEREQSTGHGLESDVFLHTLSGAN